MFKIKVPKQRLLTLPLATAQVDLEEQLKLGRKVISMVPYYEVSSLTSTKLAGYMVVVALSKEERHRVVH